MSIYAILGELRDFIEGKADKQFWVYSDYYEQGSLLIKNMADGTRMLIKPWDTGQMIGLNRIREFIDDHPTFRGYEVDNYLFIGRNFRDNSIRQAKVKNSFTLIEVDYGNKEIHIYGSMNIDTSLLNTVIEFADSYKYEISYDFEGILRHYGFRNGAQHVERVESRVENPTAFVSYSWDSKKHQLWVLKLSSDLIKNGVNVIVDEWDLKKYRYDIHKFIESGIRESDYVIMVCTPNYVSKSNLREGGVGIENIIITGEYYDKNNAEKYIPIVRNYKGNIKDSLPSYLRTKYSLDFKDDSRYEEKFEDLLRRILKKPKFIRPKLGQIPDLTSDEI